jgi:hypothetical protein
MKIEQSVMLNWVFNCKYNPINPNVIQADRSQYCDR